MTIITKYVSKEQLKRFGWVNVNEELIQDLNFTLEKYNINIPERIRHFLSQYDHEFVLGKYTKKIADGRQYEYRRDLCSTELGDGPKYKGTGFIQLTGKCNYEKFAYEMGDSRIMECVDYVSKKYPWASFGF